MTTDFKQLLAAAKLPERTVQLCLRGDLVAEFEALDRELAEAEKTVSNSLAGNGTGDLLDRMDALQAQMRESTATVRLRAMPKPAFRALVQSHPPRRDPETNEMVDADKFLGVNGETFFDALIRACWVDPVLDDADWQQLVAVLSDRQYDELSDAAWSVNRSEVDIPFSPAASRMRRASADESNLPTGSA
jgi:hypothetical protein